MKQKLLLLTALFVFAVSLIGSIGFSQSAQAAFPGKNGKIAFATNRDGNFEIYTMNFDASNPVNLTNNPAPDFEPHWSPDGKKIVFRSQRDSADDLYLINSDGSGLQRLTNAAGADIHGSFSPDGTKIIFSSQRDGGEFELYTMNIDGSSQTRLTNNTIREAGSKFSPDGNKILYVNGVGASEIYIMNSDGTNPINLTNNAAIDSGPDWSPDGSKIVFYSTRTAADIYTMNADGTSPVRITTDPNIQVDPNWSPDGTKLIFQSNADGDYEILTSNTDGSNQVALTNNAFVDQNARIQPQIGTTITDPNDPNRITTTVAASESYPILDYTVDSNQTLILDGQLCDVTVASGGVLMGTGTACTITVEPGGTISSWLQSGCLSSGNLSLSGTYTAEIGGTTACTQYDQLQVTGTVTVGGSLSLSLINGFTPAAGNSFTIITNDSTDPVTGTFAGLPEGSTITLNGYVFKISYVGGTDNDVVLTTQSVPASASTPTTTPTAPNTGTSQTPIAPSLLLLIAGAGISLVGLRAYTKRRGYKISSRA